MITFKNSLTDIQFNPNGRILGEGMRLQNNDDLFFRAKQKEIVDQYTAARIFLSETEKKFTDHWFKATDDVITDDEMCVYLKSIFYESALQYYNIVLDLSWVLVYSSIECFFYRTENDIVPLKGIQDVKKARESLKMIEEHTLQPENNSVWEYLENIAPQFNGIIEETKRFWNYHRNSIIRNRNNYIKHKGKPLYNELDEGKVCSIFIEKGKHIYQMASGITDVSERYSLEEAIKELIVFDDDKLFPYVKYIIKELEAILKPSVAV